MRRRKQSESGRNERSAWRKSNRRTRMYHKSAAKTPKRAIKVNVLTLLLQQRHGTKTVIK